jgi:hypothetical protein
LLLLLLLLLLFWCSASAALLFTCIPHTPGRIRISAEAREPLYFGEIFLSITRTDRQTALLFCFLSTLSYLESSHFLIGLAGRMELYVCRLLERGRERQANRWCLLGICVSGYAWRCRSAFIGRQVRSFRVQTGSPRVKFKGRENWLREVCRQAGKHRYEFNPQKLQGFCFNKKGSCRDGFLWFVSSRLEFILVGRHIIFVVPRASREGGVRIFQLWRTSVLSEPFFQKHPVKSLHPLRKLRNC